MRKKVGFGKKSKSSVTDTRCISDYFYLIIHAFGKKSKATVKIRGKNDYWAGPSFIWKIVGKKKGVENDDELLNWDPNRTSPRKRNDLQILKELSSSLGSCHFFWDRYDFIWAKNLGRNWLSTLFIRVLLRILLVF